MKDFLLTHLPNNLWMRWAYAVGIGGFLLLLLLWRLPFSAATIEQYYSRGMYPAVARPLVTITRALPISITAVVGVALPLLWFGAMLKSWRSFAKSDYSYDQTSQRQTKRHFGSRNWQRILGWWWMWLARASLLLAILASWFLLTWGFNYQRVPVNSLFAIGKTGTGATEADLETLAQKLLTIMTDYAIAHPNGYTDVDVERAFAAGRARLQALVQEKTGVDITLPSHTKPTISGFLLLSGQATGVISPWFLEAHTDGALPPPYLLAIGLHELCHIVGYAGEADADFLSALAGLQADNELMRYAMALKVFGQVAWRLPTGSYQKLLEQLPPLAKTDLQAMYDINKKYTMPKFIENSQRQIYDQYLKSQGVSAGIADYGRMVNWLSEASEQGLF